MRNLASFRPSHFFVPLLLVGGGAVAGSLAQMTEFFTSLFNVLPTLLLLLGGAFCLVYGRVRQLFLLLVVYLLYFFLDNEVDHFRLTGAASADAALVFHLGSLLLPLLYGLYGGWQERAHLLQDLIARTAVLLATLGVVVALARRFPEGLLSVTTQIYWPLLHGQWMSLVQLAYIAFAGSLLLLAIQYLRQPRPSHAAQLIGLAGLLWMLPKVFILPHALGVMSSLVMLAQTAALAHEAYQMAYRDELTGLPGRRALNERLQRLPRSYVIAMGDVDHFKKFNDTHGHDVGDQVLRMVAAQLRKVGGGGKAYRYGGEEFTLLFTGKDADDCLPHLEAVRQAIESYSLQLRDRQQRPADNLQGRNLRSNTQVEAVSVTMSLGVAARSDELRSADAVLKAADQALYSAKSAGRNRVFVQGQNRRGAVRLKPQRGA
ncbi:GGDEF domain-containing protein [Pseudomonas kuykendallii]|uniref:GGDEF domain-containing protein n=1 Tax=Pseudomonas kuykendallii TaxID=1007099 RepID=UPI0028D8277E|nr:GGDEF domain-containing protein [Pseudomonas kuykendallii]